MPSKRRSETNNCKKKTISASNIESDGSCATVKYVTELGPNDILLGRGANISKNEGNVRFRTLVNTRKVAYNSTNRHQNKDAITRQILLEIKRRGGKFLKRVESKKEAQQLNIPNEHEDVWIFAPKHVIKEKIKQALRDKENVVDPSLNVSSVPRITIQSPSEVTVPLHNSTNGIDVVSSKNYASLGNHTLQPQHTTLSSFITPPNTYQQGLLHQDMFRTQSAPPNLLMGISHGSLLYDSLRSQIALPNLFCGIPYMNPQSAVLPHLPVHLDQQLNIANAVTGVSGSASFVNHSENTPVCCTNQLYATNEQSQIQNPTLQIVPNSSLNQNISQIQNSYLYLQLLLQLHQQQQFNQSTTNNTTPQSQPSNHLTMSVPHPNNQLVTQNDRPVLHEGRTDVLIPTTTNTCSTAAVEQSTGQSIYLGTEVVQEHPQPLLQLCNSTVHEQQLNTTLLGLYHQSQHMLPNIVAQSKCTNDENKTKRI